MSTDERLIDPDCRDGKCGSCVGGPCEHECHTDLRTRLAKALFDRVPSPTTWEKILTFETLRECRDRYFAEADAVVAALVAHSGDLHQQVTEEIRTSLRQWDAMGIDGRPGVTLADFLTASVLALPAVAVAEARVEHAEAGAQLSSERLAKVRTELDRLWSPAPDSAGRHAAHCEWGAASGAYCSCVGLAEIARLRAERDALKVAVEALAERWENALAPDRRYARDLRAALNAETTTTPARETA